MICLHTSKLGMLSNPAAILAYVSDLVSRITYKFAIIHLAAMIMCSITSLSKIYFSLYMKTFKNSSHYLVTYCPLSLHIQNFNGLSNHCMQHPPLDNDCAVSSEWTRLISPTFIWLQETHAHSYCSLFPHWEIENENNTKDESIIQNKGNQKIHCCSITCNKTNHCLTERNF